MITTTDEHFGLLGPLHTSGAKVVVVDPEPERIVEAVTPRTRLLALSHALWTTGAVLPVHELRATTGLPILVDGAQSVGAMAVDASGLDYYTISGQKWLCGPEGTGALVVAEPEALGVARPSYLSQQATSGTARSCPRTARRGSNPTSRPRRTRSVCGPRFGPFHRGRTSGPASSRSASGPASPRLGWTSSYPRAARHSSPGGSPHEESADVVARLAEAGVIVRDLPGRGLVRASVGWWNDESDLERLVAAL